MNKNTIFNMSGLTETTFDLLWTNEDPTVSIDTMTAEISSEVLSEYTLFCIIWDKPSSNNSVDMLYKSTIMNVTDITQSIATPMAYALVQITSDNYTTRMLRRNVQVKENGIYIGALIGYQYQYPISGDTTYVMPLYIYGIR